MNTQPSITIGIPAYNEEANIFSLLTMLLVQTANKNITQIIVSSDGSTDDTNKLVESISDERIQLLKNKDRQGLARGLNQIMDKATGDILIIVNADIQLDGQKFIATLVEGMLAQKADLVTPRMDVLPAKSFTGHLIDHSIKMKFAMYYGWKQGLNIFTCFGTARAFSKKLYTSLRFPDSVGEDAYSYMFVQKNGFTYGYVPQAVAYFKSPEVMSDHVKQSTRFFTSQALLKKYFGSQLKTEYSMPVSYMVKNYVTFFLLNPVYTVLYTGIFVYLKLFLSQHKNISNTWEIAETSKVFHETQ